MMNRVAIGLLKKVAIVGQVLSVLALVLMAVQFTQFLDTVPTNAVGARSPDRLFMVLRPFMIASVPLLLSACLYVLCSIAEQFARTPSQVAHNHSDTAP